MIVENGFCSTSEKPTLAGIGSMICHWTHECGLKNWPPHTKDLRPVSLVETTFYHAHQSLSLLVNIATLSFVDSMLREHEACISTSLPASLQSHIHCVALIYLHTSSSTEIERTSRFVD